MGYHVKDQSPLQKPVMYQEKHSPESDFSLDEFITKVIEYHNKNGTNTKTIKLNFASMDPVPQSIDMLSMQHREVYIYNIYTSHMSLYKKIIFSFKICYINKSID